MEETTTSWITFNGFSAHIAVLCAVTLGLLCVSALVSGAETSFFSLSHNDIRRLRKRTTASAEAVLRLLAAEFDPGEITLSLMRQYTPGFAPLQYRELSRCVTSFEYEFALDLAGELGFSGFSQEKDSASCAYTPDFAGKGGEVGKNFG
mgnify:CR=1 FL=1